MRRTALALAALAALPACGGGGNASGIGTGQPPFVRIVSPGPHTTCHEGATISVHVVAEDPNATIARVELFDGDRRVKGKSEAPFIFPLGGLDAGTHVLTAVATDIEGVSTVSTPVTLFVTARDQDDDDDRRK